MPNHIHGLLILGGIADDSRESVRVARRGHPADDQNASTEHDPSIPEIIGWFKTRTTNDYILGVKQYGWPPFPKRLWHRSYNDHIVRNDAALANIEACIADNPRRWAEDRFNPANPTTLTRDPESFDVD